MRHHIARTNSVRPLAHISCGGLKTIESNALSKQCSVLLGCGQLSDYYLINDELKAQLHSVSRFLMARDWWLEYKWLDE